MIEIYAAKNEPGKGHETGLMLLSFVFQKKFPGRVMPGLISGPKGKPYFSESGHFEFNISHSGIWTVVGVSDRPLGVDIQEIREIRSPVIRRFYTPRENEYIDSLPAAEKNSAAVRIWSIKEAVTKAEGSALAVRLSEIQTVAFDNTLKTSVDGFNLIFPEFIDGGYCLSAASAFDKNAQTIYL